MINNPIVQVILVLAGIWVMVRLALAGIAVVVWLAGLTEKLRAKLARLAEEKAHSIAKKQAHSISFHDFRSNSPGASSGKATGN